MKIIREITSCSCICSANKKNGDMHFQNLHSADRKGFQLCFCDTKIVSEYDQKIPQSQTADNPMAPRGRAAHPHETPGRQIKQSNQPSLPHQDE